MDLGFPRASEVWIRRSMLRLCPRQSKTNKDKCIAKAQDEPPDQVEGEGGGSR